MTNRLVPMAWLIVMMLVSVTIVSACSGGGESPTATSTPRSTQPTEEPPPTPTSGNQATEQRTPTAAPDAAAESGRTSDVQRYIDTNCTLSEEDDPETWGEAAQQFEEQLERLRRNSPPEELREYFEAKLAVDDLALEFFESKDPSERLDPDDPGTDFYQFIESPEYQAAFAVVQEAIDKMDRDLFIAVNDAGC